MDYKELLDYCKATALANALEPTEESVYRSICRSYSKTFSTPLHEVMELDPEFVTLSYYENEMDDVEVEENVEGLLDTVYGMQDPEYEKEKQDELKDFMKKAEEEEEQRVKAGKPIHKALKEEQTMPTLKTEPPTPKQLPTSGGVNMSYFNEDNER